VSDELSFDEIVSIVRARQTDRHPLLLQMEDIRHRYNADWIVPLGSSEDGPQLPPMTPTIIAESVDFAGRGAASQRPTFSFPAIDPGKERGMRSREYAAIRHKATSSLWATSQVPLLTKRYFRHLAGYASGLWMVTPDHDAMLPAFELRDPLSAFPEQKAPEDVTPIRNCAFIYPRSAETLRALYPECAKENGGVVAKPTFSAQNQMWDVVEWVDERSIVLGVLGTRDYRNSAGYSQLNVASGSQEVRRWDNRAEMCPAILSNQITLDRIGSQIANITGIVDFMTRLQALAVLAAEKNIFRDRYVLGRGATTPRLLGDEWKDGRSGETNILLDADSVGELGGGSDPVNQQMIDRLERNVRISTGLVPQAGGENYTSLRTGRAMDSIMSASVDPRIQEMHEIAEVAFTNMNRVALSMWKKTWGSKSYSMWSGLRTDRGHVDITPNIHIESLDHSVTYPMPGADAQSMTIIAGQLLGMDAISMRTARILNPNIDDPDGEGQLVVEEKLEEGVLAALVQGAVSGQIPPVYLAKVQRHIQKGDDIFAATAKADEELRKEQAQIAPDPAEGQFAPPEQMPGLTPGAPGPVPPTAGQLPPELMAMMGGAAGAPEGGGALPPGMAPGAIGPNEDQRGLRRLMEALSQSPVAGQG